MDNEGETGIERAAEQGVAAFEAQQFPSSPPPPPPPIDPFTPGIPGMSPNDLYTRPHFMEGGWNVSADRMSWWNGAMWVPGRPPGSSPAGKATGPGSPIVASPIAQLVLFVVGLAVMAVIGFTAWNAFQTMPTLGPTP